MRGFNRRAMQHLFPSQLCMSWRCSELPLVALARLLSSAQRLEMRSTVGTAHKHMAPHSDGLFRASSCRILGQCGREMPDSVQ